MAYYMVTFQWDESGTVFCTNIAHAKSEADVQRKYSEYIWLNVRKCYPGEVENFKLRGMPIVEC